MRSKRQNKKILLLILLLTVTVGFALLSTTLQINGISRIKGNIWNIHWDSTSIRINNDSIATATGPTVSTVTTTDDTVAFEVNLELPGEFFEFTVDAVNEGTIDGYINSVTKFIYDKDDYDTNEDEATPIEPTNITFTVVYDDNGEEPEGWDLLEKCVDSTTPTRRTYKVRVEFNSTATNVPATDTTYMCVFKTTYGQSVSNNGGGQQSGGNEPSSNPYLTTFDGNYTYSNGGNFGPLNNEWTAFLRNDESIYETCGVFGSGQAGTVCLTSSYYNDDYSNDNDEFYYADFEDCYDEETGDYFGTGEFTSSDINNSCLKGYAKTKAVEMLNKGASSCYVYDYNVDCYMASGGDCGIDDDGDVYCYDDNGNGCYVYTDGSYEFD